MVRPAARVRVSAQRQGCAAQAPGGAWWHNLECTICKLGAVTQDLAHVVRQSLVGQG